MKKMILLAAVLGLFLTACQQSGKERSPVSKGRGDGGGITPPVTGTAFNSLWGAVSGAADFNDKVHLFSLSNFDSADLGTVGTADTGVRIYGEAPLAGLNLLNVTQTATVTAETFVVFGIFDSYLAQGLVKKPAYIELSSAKGVTASGTVTKTGAQYRAEITFTDQIGWVKLDGQITPEGGSTANDLMYRGKVTFMHNCKFNPATNACDITPGVPATELGNFEVKACGFFHCN